jgi:hypothetical protein
MMMWKHKKNVITISTVRCKHLLGTYDLFGIYLTPIEKL